MLCTKHSQSADNYVGLLHDRYCQLRHLHGYYRLHGYVSRLPTPLQSTPFCSLIAPHPLHTLTQFLVAAYGPYAASATGGNGFARDFLAGIAAMYSTPFFEYFPAPYTLEYPTTILAVLAFIVTIPIFVFYYKGKFFLYSLF